MPGRPFFFDLRSRNDTICRSCLLSTRQRTTPTTSQTKPWTVAYSSQAGRQKPRRRAQPQPRPRPGLRTPDLLKKLEQSNPASQNGADFKLDYWEEDEHGHRTRLEDDGSFEQGLSGLDASGLANSLSGLKSVIGSKDESDAFDEVMSQIGGGLDRVRTVEDIEALMKKAPEYDAKLDREILDTVAKLPMEMQNSLYENFGEFLPRPSDRKSLGPPAIPDNQSSRKQKKISLFNNAIRRVWRAKRGRKGLTEEHTQALYKAYFAVRPTLTDDWTIVPIDVWDFLWEVFAAQIGQNKNRLAHIYLLARDMGEAKVTLSPKQQLLTIEAVFIGGWEDKAMENWKRCVATLGAEGRETFLDFWELGARMHSRMGNLDQAEKAVELLLSKDFSPRVLLPIIRARSERGAPGDYEAAWNSYRRMKDLFAQNMELEDYDQVIACFLASNQTDNGFSAFVDMMSRGTIDLKQLHTLPSTVSNKFFVGKWLKRLIGAGDLDGAYRVVEYMRQKGIGTSAVQLNGLVGAWHRSGGAENAEKAEKLAWDMIKTRIEFVRARKMPPGTTAPASLPSLDRYAPLPRATLETFCVLAENYRSRGLNDRMAELWTASREAEISPDAFMMNQLLELYMQSGEYKQAMALYTELVKRQGVKPDPFTFSALWKTLSINRLHHVEDSALSSAAVAARQMFAETAQFRDVFPAQGMDMQLARKILHTFRRLKDTAGFLVALASLKEIFNFLPTEILVLEMVLGTTKISWETPQLRRQMLTAKRDIDWELEAWAGRDADKIQGERRPAALFAYMLKKFWPKSEDNAAVEKALLEVASQMGVGETLVPKA